MRDFFARQEEARGKSRQLYVLFALAVVAIVLLVYTVAWFGYIWVRTDQLTREVLPFWDGALLRTVALPTLLLILGGSWYKIAELRDGGGRRVAELLGGRPVLGTSGDPAERQLLNIVEEIAIAAGVPVPDVFLLERERGINAFAAGFGADDAVICVTEGTLRLLTREEQQGVVAHEFSHLLNGDSLVNIRLMGLLHGLLLIALGGELLLRTGSDSRNRGGGALLIGLILFLLGYIGVFFGNLVKSAISRQREYLADAAAVQFTRNPLGLAGALKKIAALGDAGAVGHAQSLAISHMYFSDDNSAASLSILATHPPLLERIRLLDPAFDGTLPAVEPLPAPPLAAAYTAPARLAAAGRAATAHLGSVPAPLSGAAAITLLETIGAPQQEHAERARAILASLPTPLREATREASGACAVVYALLCADSADLSLLGGETPAALREEVDRLLPLLRALPSSGRLPLVDLTLPALRTLSEPQYQTFIASVRRLVLADGKTDIFEFALLQVLSRQLESRFGRSAPAPVQFYALRGVATECSCILSLLAHAGQRDTTQVAEAFAAATRLLQEQRLDLALLPLTECPPSRLIAALTSLAALSLPLKRRVLAAGLASLVHDEKITVAEAELFRGLAEALGCPAPRWLLAGA